jgi:acyl carrier protein
MQDLTNFEEIKTKIKGVIAYDLDVAIDIDEIHDETTLFDGGLWLDSIAIINLIVLLEQKFSITFDENEISSQLFSSVSSLASYIAAKAPTVN